MDMSNLTPEQRKLFHRLARQAAVLCAMNLSDWESRRYENEQQKQFRDSKVGQWLAKLASAEEAEELLK